MSASILVTGGARSGKSAFAQRHAGTLGGDRVLFVATAEARDVEMTERIAAHRAARPSAWRTLEAPRDVAAAVRAAGGAHAVVVLDCLTLLVSNLLDSPPHASDAAAARDAVFAELEAILSSARSSSATWIVVTNEVGSGLVPETPLGRTYRDLLGAANQRLAAAAEQVFLLTSGIAIDLKRLEGARGGA